MTNPQQSVQASRPVLLKEFERFLCEGCDNLGSVWFCKILVSNELGLV